MPAQNRNLQDRCYYQYGPIIATRQQARNQWATIPPRKAQSPTENGSGKSKHQARKSARPGKLLKPAAKKQ
ncbi:hypothetical protein COO20_15590 [Thalassospira marina]|uniref:Uncharacterized protein n=1 Tax=Thalassospira marina TaxID=2048283 RepID=A0A2N3KRA2_9PROT|nr:hypothetical protein COO20_15590 [Thalassospira marina]